MGTRPEIIKLSPVVTALTERQVPVRSVATGQHYDPSLTDIFFEELGIHPDERWASEDADEATRLGRLTSLAERELARREATLVLLLGDTNTVPPFCLAARRHGVPVAHLEAGLRSYNERSMEEINRKVAAACASLHLAPTEASAARLRAEGVPPARIEVVGNPAIDVLRRSGYHPLPPGERSGVVVTAHRATNVDDPERLGCIVEIVRRLAAEVGPVTFPLHPRTAARLDQTSLLERLRVAGVSLVGPLGYSDMLSVVQRSALVVTDSGGIQEETAWLKVPTLVMRHSTPRWEGVAAGLAILTGTDVELTLEAARRATERDAQVALQSVPCPYGDGHTGERVAALLADGAWVDRFRPREPDFVGAPIPS